jgi:hypothetical protein
VQATSISKCAILVCEGSLRLDILLSVHPLFLFNSLRTTMERFMYLICSHSHYNSPYLEDSSCAKTWVLQSCTFSPLLLGSLFVWTIGRGFHPILVSYHGCGITSAL